MENDGNLDDVLIMESLKTLANKSNNLNNTTKKSLQIKKQIVILPICFIVLLKLFDELYHICQSYL